MDFITKKVTHLKGEGCLPFYDVDSGIKGHIPQCDHIDTNSFLKIAENRSEISIVVMSSRGPFYINGTGFGSIEADAKRYIKMKDTLDTGGYADIYKESMKETLSRLLAKNKTIYFILDIPELGFDPKTCVDSRPLRLTNHIKHPCAVSRHDFDQRNGEYRKIAMSVLENFPTVKIFDAGALFCDDKWCWAMKNGKVLYRDDDHLSMEGSRYVASKLAPLLLLENR